MKNVYKELHRYALRMELDEEQRAFMFKILPQCLEKGLVPTLQELEALARYRDSEVEAIIKWESLK